MKLQLLFWISLLLFFIIIPSFVEAHPGRTDSNGGHTCRTNCEKWGLEYGEYHYHGGNETIKDERPTQIPTPSPKIIISPIPITTLNPTPKVTAKPSSLVTSPPNPLTSPQPSYTPNYSLNTNSLTEKNPADLSFLFLLFSLIF